MELPKVEGPYLSREERLERRYATPITPSDPRRGDTFITKEWIPVVPVSTAVIKTVEKDVRALLDHMESEYTNDELRQAMKRLRKWVGYK